MKAKSVSLGNSVPKVIMMYQQAENIDGATALIAEQFDEYRTLKVTEENTKFLIRTKPAVILVALETAEDSVAYYGELVEQGKLDYPHYSILMCNNKQSALSFHCCLKGLFDNYFVYQPIYERYRLRLIVHYGLVCSAAKAHYLSKQEEYTSEVDEELAQLIEDASNCKNSLIQRINESEQHMMDAVAKIENESQVEQVDPISPKELMTALTENHLKPLLSVLENDIKSSLDQMISQMVNQKSNNQNQVSDLKTAAAQPVRQATQATALAAKSKEQQQLLGEQDTLAQDDEELADIGDKKGILNPPPIPKEKEETIENARKILVVEDNALYREMLVNVLTKEKFAVDQAMDGINALQKIKDDDFDLIIMDLFMPKLDGLNTTKKIRQFSGGKDVPVIALTGNKNKEIVKKWAAYGLKGYIMKPSTKEQILSSVARAVN
ncbi:response regulator [Thalassotalea fusca]